MQCLGSVGQIRGQVLASFRVWACLYQSTRFENSGPSNRSPRSIDCPQRGTDKTYLRIPARSVAPTRPPVNRERRDRSGANRAAQSLGRLTVGHSAIAISVNEGLQTLQRQMSRCPGPVWFQTYANRQLGSEGDSR